MRRFPAFIMVFGVLAMAVAASRAMAQDGPPGGPDSGGPGSTGGPAARRGGGPGGPGGQGGFHLIPRFAVEKLKLTEEQQKAVADLEKETKAKLYKILTPEQQKALESARPPRPGQGGPGGGRRGPGGQGRGGAGGPGGPGGDSPGNNSPGSRQRPDSE